jgi:hypothetical protein
MAKFKRNRSDDESREVVEQALRKLFNEPDRPKADKADYDGEDGVGGDDYGGGR